jgi:Predicted outer membrane protein
MPRRLAVVGLAAVFACPAFAQQVQQNQAIPYPVTPQPAETQTNQGLGQNAQQREQRVRQGGAPQDTRAQTNQSQGPAGATAQMSQPQSQADRQYVEQTLAAGTVSLQASNFAATKAQNPRVKQFAGFEIAEQNTLSEVMHSLAEPTATSSTTTGAQQAASTAPELPQADAAAMERMSKAQGGPDFDKDYVAMQLKGHQDLFAMQERYLQGNPQNRELTNVARLALGQIREHIALLQDIQKELGH